MSNVTNIPPAAQAEIARTADAVGDWTFQAGRSAIGFQVKNFWGLAKVKGTFNQASGAAHVTDDGAIAATLTIDSGSVDTKQKKRDEHLRSKDFFDVENFPEMTVTVDRVDLTASDAGVARGTITVLGETRPADVELRIDLPSGSRTAVVSAATTVDRGAFGMEWRPMKMAGMDVKIEAELVFTKSPG